MEQFPNEYDGDDEKDDFDQDGQHTFEKNRLLKDMERFDQLYASLMQQYEVLTKNEERMSDLQKFVKMYKEGCFDSREQNLQELVQKVALYYLNAFDCFNSEIKLCDDLRELKRLGMHLMEATMNRTNGIRLFDNDLLQKHVMKMNGQMAMFGSWEFMFFSSQKWENIKSHLTNLVSLNDENPNNVDDIN